MTLEGIKAHLVISHNQDDALIQAYADAAEQGISNYLGEPYNSAKANQRQAKLLLVGNFYANREAVVTGTMVTKLPYGIEFLLDADLRPRL